MSKRLERIKPAQLPGALEKILQFSVNAVLRDGNTIFGRLESFNSDQLVLTDTRDHEHRIRFGDLYEVVYDVR